MSPEGIRWLKISTIYSLDHIRKFLDITGLEDVDDAFWAMGQAAATGIDILEWARLIQQVRRLH